MSLNLHSSRASTDEKLKRLNHNLQALLKKSKSLYAANIVAMNNEGETVVVLSDNSSGCHIWSLCFVENYEIFIADSEDRFFKVKVNASAAKMGFCDVSNQVAIAIRGAQRSAQESSATPVPKISMLLKAVYQAAVW